MTSMSEFPIIHTILGPVINGGVWGWLESEKDREDDGGGGGGRMANRSAHWGF